MGDFDTGGACAGGGIKCAHCTSAPLSGMIRCGESDTPKLQFVPSGFRQAQRTARETTLLPGSK